MTSQEVLTKAINLAIAGGWNQIPFLGDDWDATDTEDVKEVVEILIKYQAAYKLFIFNQDFAKALWPGAPIIKEGFYQGLPAPNWQYHLRDMVIADDPLKYLEKHWDDRDLLPVNVRVHAALNRKPKDD